MKHIKKKKKIFRTKSLNKREARTMHMNELVHMFLYRNLITSYGNSHSSRIKFIMKK